MRRIYVISKSPAKQINSDEDLRKLISLEEDPLVIVDSEAALNEMTTTLLELKNKNPRAKVVIV